MLFPEEEIVLVSALNEYAFCPRRCAFKHVEKVFTPNVHTISGTIEHENTDVPGYEVRDGVKILRALSLSSEKLGLSGKADWVEMRDGLPYPVEMKHGIKRAWDNDDIQLCAQALCLDEMMGVTCPMGAIYHSKSRHRREGIFGGRNQPLAPHDYDRCSRDIPARSVGAAREGARYLRPRRLPVAGEHGPD